MGMIRGDFGRFSIEQRSESFIIHSDDTFEHPEYDLDDLDNLLDALHDLALACGSDGTAAAE
jgi:hypothetical protein